MLLDADFRLPFAAFIAAKAVKSEVSAAAVLPGPAKVRLKVSRQISCGFMWLELSAGTER
jgi:hypothetical protein